MNFPRNVGMMELNKIAFILMKVVMMDRNWIYTKDISAL